MPHATRKRSTGRQLFGLAVLAIVAWFGYRVIYGGSSIKTAISGPETIVSDTITLDEGQAKSYGFSLSSQRRLELSVKASPQPINVMLMDSGQFEEYRRVRGKLFGGRYTYMQAFAAQGATAFSHTEMVPEGTWVIIVERPQESLMFTDKTSVTLTVRGL